MRCTVARPMPVPGNSRSACSRWNGANSFSTYFMSKPAPLSRTMKRRGRGSGTATNSIRALAVFDVNFQALPSRFSRTMRASDGSQRACRLSSIIHVTLRVGLRSLRSATDLARDLERSTSIALNLRARETRQLQQIVDQPAHALGRVAHARQMILSGFVEPIAPVLAQRLREAVDAAQRRAQVVRHGIAERLELAVEEHLLVHRALAAPC